MQYPPSPYLPNNSSSDDNTTYPSSLLYTEEHSDSDSNNYRFQSPPTHVQPNNTRYYAGLDPGLPQYPELAWNNRMRQPLESYNPDFPYHTSNLTPPASDQYLFPPTAQHAPFYRMSDDPARSVAGYSAPDMSFHRVAEGPRLRTAQACQKCRTRKAKCSGDHPACERCLIKGLTCEYASEGRVRGPNKLRIKAGSHHEFTAGPSSSGPAADSPYAVTEPSPSIHHARQHMGEPIRSQSELGYSGGRDIGGPSGTQPGIPFRSSHPSSTSPSFSRSPAFGEQHDVQYQHTNTWAAPSSYQSFYDHQERHPS